VEQLAGANSFLLSECAVSREQMAEGIVRQADGCFLQSLDASPCIGTAWLKQQ
jgi:hypothetical protein